MKASDAMARSGIPEPAALCEALDSTAAEERDRLPNDDMNEEQRDDIEPMNDDDASLLLIRRVHARCDAWRRRTRLLRMKARHWRHAWVNEETRGELLYHCYMTALDSMTDADQLQFFYRAF